jgi:GNAT superfamily N-acetyltransferase
VNSFRITKIDRHHAVDDFDCGEDDLNRFLSRHAFNNLRANSSTTYLAMMDDVVDGYYTIVVGQVHLEDAPERMSKGLAQHPVPLVVLARLAVDRRWQGKGIGSGLLKDAMLRALNVSEIAGVRALAVHARDEDVAAWYERFGFIPSPTDRLHLYLLMKDIRAARN